jgi:hypothetical protein
VEASMVGCSRCCHGEVVPRPRQVGRVSSASPCQLGKHLGDWWVLPPSSSFLFIYKAAAIGHLGHDWLRQAYRLGSVVLLADACLMIESISYYWFLYQSMPLLCLNPSVSSAHCTDKDVSLHLMVLQSSVMNSCCYAWFLAIMSRKMI